MGGGNAGENVGNVNGQNVARNVGGNHARAGRLPPAGGVCRAVSGAGGGYFGRCFVRSAAILHKSCYGRAESSEPAPHRLGVCRATRGRVGGITSSRYVLLFRIVEWLRMVLICNSTVQQSGTRSVWPVGRSNLPSVPTSRVSGASAQAKRGSHQAGCRHGCLVPPTLRHS